MGTGGMNVPLVLKIRSGCEGGGKGPLIQEDRSATLSCNNDQTLFELSLIHIFRDRYIQEHPLCELCQQEGRLTPAEEVHHKKPLAEGGTHARDNLIALCKSCHARIHAQRGDRWHQQKG